MTSLTDRKRPTTERVVKDAMKNVIDRTKRRMEARRG